MATSTPASPLRRPASASLRPQSKPKLSRRWSLDNINSKEGYVKDLRKQHQAQQVRPRDSAIFQRSDRELRQSRHFLQRQIRKVEPQLLN